MLSDVSIDIERILRKWADCDDTEGINEMSPREVTKQIMAVLAEREGAQKKVEEIQCPVCGYYCLGKGGFGCIDKPSMIASRELDAQAKGDVVIWEAVTRFCSVDQVNKISGYVLENRGKI